MNAAESCALVAHLLESDYAFTLARFGDGDLYCMKADTADEAAAMLQATLGDRPGRPSLALADGEVWSEDLRDALRDAWEAITGLGQHELLLGDPKTSGFGVELYPYWDDLTFNIFRPFGLVHHEMFWLHADPQPELLRFCRALRDSKKRKLLIGRPELAPAAALVEAEFIAVDPFDSLRDVFRVVQVADKYPVVLVCAGRGGKAMIHGLLDRRRTIIDLGSLFDPLYIANSRPRAGMPTDAQAEAFFSDLAGQPVRVSPNRPGRAYG